MTWEHWFFMGLIFGSWVYMNEQLRKIARSLEDLTNQLRRYNPYGDHK